MAIHGNDKGRERYLDKDKLCVNDMDKGVTGLAARGAWCTGMHNTWPCPMLPVSCSVRNSGGRYAHKFGNFFGVATPFRGAFPCISCCMRSHLPECMGAFHGEPRVAELWRPFLGVNGHNFLDISGPELGMFCQFIVLSSMLISFEVEIQASTSHRSLSCEQKNRSIRYHMKKLWPKQ